MDKRKVKLSSAILGLKYLVENHPSKEEKYQDFFEENPIVFEVLGYIESHPMRKGAIKLPKDESSGLKPEPDFIVRNPSGIYEIFELKTPKESKLLNERNQYREKFTAKVNEYVSQTITYERYFTRNPKNRENLKTNYNIDIQEDLDIKIIIGLNNDLLDKRKVHQKCRESKYKIDIITYDDILDKLTEEYASKYGLYEGIKGVSFQFIVKFYEKEGNSYFLDIGNETKRNRISFYLDKFNDFIMELFDSEGRSHKASILNKDNQLIEQWFFITCEFAKKDGNLYLCTYLNGLENFQTLVLNNSNINIDLNKSVLGTDLQKKNYGKFDLTEKLVISRTLTYEDRNYMLNYLANEHGQEFEKISSFLRFNGTKYMYQSDNGFSQKNKNFQPKLIEL